MGFFSLETTLRGYMSRVLQESQGPCLFYGPPSYMSSSYEDPSHTFILDQSTPWPPRRPFPLKAHASMLPFRKDTLNLVTLIDCFTCQESLQWGLREAWRVLVLDGRVVLMMALKVYPGQKSRRLLLFPWRARASCVEACFSIKQFQVFLALGSDPLWGNRGLPCMSGVLVVEAVKVMEAPLYLPLPLWKGNASKARPHRGVACDKVNIES